MTSSNYGFSRSLDNRGSGGRSLLQDLVERPKKPCNCGFHHPYCPEFKYCKEHPNEYGIYTSQSKVSNKKSSNSRPNHTDPSDKRQAQDGKLEYQCDPCKTEKDKSYLAEVRERKEASKRKEAEERKEKMEADRDMDGDTLCGDDLSIT